MGAQTNIVRMEASELNELYADRCVWFLNNGRRQAGIIDQFIEGSNVVSIRRGDDFIEVPRNNVLL